MHNFRAQLFDGPGEGSKGGFEPIVGAEIGPDHAHAHLFETIREFTFGRENHQVKTG